MASRVATSCSGATFVNSSASRSANGTGWLGFSPAT
jgi:hypothetical protein